jgi:hypothetical protein
MTVTVEVVVLEEEFLLGSDPIGNVRLRSSETESSQSNVFEAAAHAAGTLTTCRLPLISRTTEKQKRTENAGLDKK